MSFKNDFYDLLYSKLVQIKDLLFGEGGIFALKKDLEAETAAREAYDAQQDQKIQTLNGHYYPLDGYDFGKSLDVKTPNPDDVSLLTGYAMTVESVSEVAQIIDGTVVKNLFDGVEFIWNATSQTWQDWGIGNIVTASNEHLGVVEGTADPGDGSKDGMVTVHPGGPMETIGFTGLKGAVAERPVPPDDSGSFYAMKNKAWQKILYPPAAVYADAVNGDDSNPGTSAAPVQTFAKAVELLQAIPAGSYGGYALVLRDGTYTVPPTFLFPEFDRMVTIRSSSGNSASVILEVSSTTGNALSFMGDVLLEYLTITGSAPAYYSLIYHMIGSIRINRCIFAGPGISASNTRAIEFDTDTALVIICGFHDFHMVFNAVGALLNVLSWNAENTADNSTLVTGSGSFVSMTNLPPDGSFIALKSLGVGQVLVGDNQINTIRIKLADLENNFDVVFLLGRIPTESSDSPHFTNITEGEVRLLRNGTIGQAPALKIVGFNVAAGYGAPYMTANFNIKLNSGSAVFALGAVTWEGGRYIVIRAAHPLGFRYYNYLKGEFDGSMPMSMIGKMLNFSDVTGWELIAGTV